MNDNKSVNGWIDTRISNKDKNKNSTSIAEFGQNKKYQINMLMND